MTTSPTLPAALHTARRTEEFCRRALEIGPALLYRDTGRYAEAERSWLAALAAQPDFVPSLIGLGDCYLRAGQLGAATGVLSRLAEVSPEAADHFQRRMAAAHPTVKFGTI